MSGSSNHGFCMIKEFLNLHCVSMDYKMGHK
jgi:hypothetical protein